MNTFYNSASEAMSVAYSIAQQTHRRVYRHQTENRHGSVRWIVSFIECPQKALQELIA